MALASQPTTYLSSLSANALISDHRPTTLAPLALAHLNTLLDELLISLLSSAQSLNPFDLRREAVPSVFSGGEKGLTGDSTTGTRALGRSAVAEAEVELRSWHEGRKGGRGFPPDGKGSGTRSERSFPLMQAIDLMRLKCVAFSTLAPQDAQDESVEEEALAAWKKVGGDISPETVEPAALWITAIIEHVCEHILSQLSRVVAREAGMAVAGPQDLYTALCEDDSVWGLFKKMRVKEQLETVIRSSTKPKRGIPTRNSSDSRSVGCASPAMSTTTSRDGSRVTPPRDTASFDTTRGMSPVLERAGVETNHMGGIVGGIIRKGSTLSRKNPHGGSPTSKHLHNQHERTGSVLSVTTRSMLGAFEAYHEAEEDEDEQSTKEAQDEFDALVRSGETMKVSLTPSRLKNFEGRKKQAEAQSPVEQVAPRSRTNPPKSEGSRSMSINRVPVPADASPPRNPASGITVTTTTATVTSPPRLPSAGSSVTTPPSRPMRRIDSAQKRLVARGATTITEKQDQEDEGPEVRQQKKESIFDILADEDSFGPLPKERKQSPERRTVPAVVLGTPPPPGPTPTIPLPSPPKTKPAPTLVALPPAEWLPQVHPQVQPQSQIQPLPHGSINRPYRSREGSYSTSTSGEDGYAPRRQAQGRKRTEAQELADFFNSAPPPVEMAPRRGSRGEDDSAGKGRGFRGFMSKVTGSSSKKKDEITRSASHEAGGALTSASQSRLNSASGARTTSASSAKSGGGFFDGGMKRQKSLQSMASGQTGYRGYESEPPLPVMPPAVQQHQQHQQQYQQRPSHPHLPHQQQPVTQVPQRETPRKPTPPIHTPTPPAMVAPIPAPAPVGAAAITLAPAASISPDVSAPAAAPAPVQNGRTGLRTQPSSGSLRGPLPPQSLAVSGREATARETAAAAAAATSALAGVAGLVGVEKLLGGESDGEKGKKDAEVVREEAVTMRESNYMGGHSEKTLPEKKAVPEKASADQPQLDAPTIVTDFANAGNTTPGRSTSGYKSPITASPSDALSFKTADEGSEAEAETKASATVEDGVSAEGVEDIVAESEVATSVPSSQVLVPGIDSPAATPKEAVSHTTAVEAAVPAESSIALKDLVPLRNLLDHATSARECRLLLSAVLTQYGVPSTPSDKGLESGRAGPEGRDVVTPEYRVLAWLLAGREGPVGDAQLLEAEVEGEEEQGDGESTDDQVVTPTRGEPVQLTTKHTPSSAAANHPRSNHSTKPDRTNLLRETGLTETDPSSGTATEFFDLSGRI